MKIHSPFGPLAAAVLAAGGLLSAGAFAQATYPTKSITIVVDRKSVV